MLRPQYHSDRPSELRRSGNLWSMTPTLQIIYHIVSTPVLNLSDEDSYQRSFDKALRLPQLEV